MSLPQLTRRMIEKTMNDFCDRRVPLQIRNKLLLKYIFRGNTVSLYEERPVWNDPTQKTEGMIAQFRFDLQLMEWTLYYRDRNGRWHEYERIPSSRVFDDLLNEVDRDPTGIFWG
jgi:hypothetical protein